MQSKYSVFNFKVIVVIVVLFYLPVKAEYGLSLLIVLENVFLVKAGVEHGLGHQFN